MKFKIIIYLFLLLSFLPYFSQEKGTGPKEKSVSSQSKILKKDRIEAREKRRKERAERKAIKKYHKRLQTKQVRKRMKKSKSRSVLNNENKREPFFKRLLKKKKRNK
ncbi:MAG: hypothetical protein WCH21_01960 [Bacteroidota bacterium]